MDPQNDFRPFGAENVDARDKERLVKGVFDNVANNYDRMTDLMSLRVHHLWKKMVANKLDPRPGEIILDVAGGTGDLAKLYSDMMLDKYASKSDEIVASTKKGQILLCDINEEMLRVASNKIASKRGRKNDDNSEIDINIHPIVGNAEKLPVRESTIDAYSIGFGIRNVTNIEPALDEAYRVLKPGGRFVCLEFSHVAPGPIHQAYRFWSDQVMPKLGSYLDIKDETNYLVQSIQRFPKQRQFARLIEKAGFKNVRFTNVSMGIVAIHSGWKW